MANVFIPFPALGEGRGGAGRHPARGAVADGRHRTILYVSKPAAVLTVQYLVGQAAPGAGAAVRRRQANATGVSPELGVG